MLLLPATLEPAITISYKGSKARNFCLFSDVRKGLLQHMNQNGEVVKK